MPEVFVPISVHIQRIIDRKDRFTCQICAYMARIHDVDMFDAGTASSGTKST